MQRVRIMSKIGLLATLALFFVLVQTVAAAYSYGSYSSGLPMEFLALTIIIALAALYGLFVWKSMSTRLVIIGTALILMGTVAWLYGDYAGLLQDYIWDGVAAIILGTAVWIYGDMKGGAFKQLHPGKLVELGLLLIVVGAGAWIYGELYAPGVSIYWWAGTVLLLLGTIVWLYGDAKAGAFLRRKRK